MAVKTYRKGSYTKLSENFNVSEFACHGSGCCSKVKNDEQLVKYLQKIRNHFKAPVTITSSYRCPTHNKRIGGAANSYHTYGMAADIIVKGVAPAEVAKYAESIGIKGIGLYETDKDGHFVHIDTRTNKSFWYGQGCAYRSTFGGAPKSDTAYSQKQFIRDVQEACGAKVDGIAGPETLSKTITVSAKTNSRHEVVKYIQKYLFMLGYVEIGAADGVAGSKFTSAVAHFQTENGCVADGRLTAKNKTWKKLLGME